MATLITLRPAYEWTCEVCGRDHFERAIAAEMSADDREELLEAQGLEAWEEPQGVWLMMPNKVTCNHCKRKFETIHYSQDP
jgi:hypothetical protein